MTITTDVERPSTLSPVPPSSRMWRPPSPASAPTTLRQRHRQPVLFVRLSCAGRGRLIFAFRANITPWFFLLFDGFIFRPRFCFPRVFAVRVVVIAHCTSFFASRAVTRSCQPAMFYVCDRTLCDNVRPVRTSVVPLLLTVYRVFVSRIAPRCRCSSVL